jgi:hypothetical protein
MPSSLKVITTVEATGSLPYRILDRGIVEVHGELAHHYQLTPIRIGTTSNLPLRYVAERYVEDYPGDYYSYPITVDPGEIDNHLVNLHAAGVNTVRNWIANWGNRFQIWHHPSGSRNAYGSMAI